MSFPIGETSAAQRACHFVAWWLFRQFLTVTVPPCRRSSSQAHLQQSMRLRIEYELEQSASR
jgi:hypothetical protein